MKILISILILAAIGFGGWKLLQTKPEASVPVASVSDVTVVPEQEVVIETKGIDNKNVAITFIGFGPGKKHNGTFSDIRSNLTLNETVGLKGTIVVGMNSITTDTERLTTHLKTDDFFNTEIYREATFTALKLDASTKKVTGIFSIMGKSKEVTFPYVENETGYTANFTLNMKDFGIDQTFANEVIELTITVPFIK